MQQIWHKPSGRLLTTRIVYVPYLLMVYYNSGPELRFWSIKLTSVSVNVHLGPLTVIVGGRPLRD